MKTSAKIPLFCSGRTVTTKNEIPGMTNLLTAMLRL